MKPLHYLLIVFVAPPLVALAVGLVIVIASSSNEERPDPRPTGTVGVKKGGRISGPGYTSPPPAIRDFQ